MPTFIGMFDNSGVPLPGPTRLLLSIGNSLKDHGILIIAIIIILILSVKVFKKSERGENFFDSLKIRIPGIKAINIKIITSRFTRTLSTLISSGIPLLEALEIVSRIVDNKIIHNKIQLAKQDIQKGMSLSEAVETLGIFPTMVVPMIRVGEESGALDELLYKTADFYDIEIETSMEKINFLLEPILIIFMGIIIGFIIIAMTLPMFDLINTIEM
jgi:type IV pilus assembly protein PilC